MTDLITTFPLTGHTTLSDGTTVPVPYQVQECDVYFIGGTAKLSAVTNLLRMEDVFPLATDDDRALMSLWICDFRSASLGPHRELQCSFYVTYAPHNVVQANPFALLRLITADPTVKMLCHGLWNDTALAVKYNREVLGLNAQLVHANLTPDADSIAFTFHGDQRVFEAQLAQPKRQPLNVMPGLLRLFGLRGFVRIASQPWLEGRVVSPKSGAFGENREARAFIGNEVPAILRRADPVRDRLTFHDAVYRSLAFVPDFVQHARHCQFVYLTPEAQPRIQPEP